MEDKVIVGVAGMPGAGKGAFRRFVQKMGYPVVIMGDEIRNEVKRRKLMPTPERSQRSQRRLGSRNCHC
jgi:dephospho-CoA kinase